MEFDPIRRILRIRFRGMVTAADVREHVERVQAVLADIAPGFSLLTDLSELQEMELDSVRDITRVMDLCLGAGVQKVIRLIPDPNKDIGFHLLSITHYRGRVPVVVCATASEADAALAGS